MTAVSTQNSSIQHFSASSGDVVTFTRPISNLIITAPTGSAVTLKFDGLTGSMALAVGTFQFTGLRITTMTIGGSGSVTGTGVCI